MTFSSVTPVPNPLQIERVRHPFKSRHVQLLHREKVGANFVRLTLGGSDLADFVSSGFDDHFKLILPQPGYERPLLPQMVDGKPVIDGPRPTMRDYTPLRWDNRAGTLTVDFALHQNGPAADWAVQAPIGQWVGVAGPRGSLLIPSGYDWHWMFGDSSALPAIERRLAELPAGTRVSLRVAVEQVEDRRPLPSAAQVDLQWVDSLVDAAQAMDLPAGSGFIWAAGEHQEMAGLRQQVLDKGAAPKQMRISAYWKRGAADHHAELAD